MKFKLIESYKWYTNGIKTIKVYDSQTPPDGYYKGRIFNSNPWNKGLTKETDDRVLKNSQSTSKGLQGNIPWNKGLTKETSDSLKTVSDKVSKKMQGNIPWNKGLTKEVDDRIKKSGEKLSQTLSNSPRQSWNKGLTKETDQRIKKISDKLIGHESFISDWEQQKQKEYNTKKINHTFNYSKIEEDFIKELKDMYGEDDVVSPYRDVRYPFNCDAYIISQDLFIELNGTWYYGKHPFDPNNEEDIKILNIWKDKSKTMPRSYGWAIKVWTEIDPLKLETFRKNNLNFKIIYPKENVIIDR